MVIVTTIEIRRLRNNLIILLNKIFLLDLDILDVKLNIRLNINYNHNYNYNYKTKYKYIK